LVLSIALQREDQVVSNSRRLEDMLTKFLEISKAEVRLVTEVTYIRPKCNDLVLTRLSEIR
jgi:hypothetical protein